MHARSTPASLAFRAALIRALADGLSYREIERRFGAEWRTNLRPRTGSRATIPIVFVRLDRKPGFRERLPEFGHGTGMVCVGRCPLAGQGLSWWRTL